jgi:hypothetical protein
MNGKIKGSRSGYRRFSYGLNEFPDKNLKTRKIDRVLLTKIINEKRKESEFKRMGVNK